MGTTRWIGIYLFGQAEELDAIGPWEVLAYWTRTWPGDGWQAITFSADGGPVTCAQGLTVHPSHSDAERPGLDVLIYPGGQGTRRQLADHAHLDWLRRLGSEATLMTSVCTGSLVYAAAGLLHGRPATTHWQELGTLTRLDPSIHVQRDARFVDDGDIITAAGVSAGIDMALHLVRRLAGPARAGEVRRAIQYDPGPPM
ncbi:MAG: DJ-1/PfpI family protein [Actinobacteria bacterium]|nr:DJ-1/PfpI family protein [Actinomycetota bacterium]